MDLFGMWLITCAALAFGFMLGRFLKENKKAAR
ncbi:hypothetical protein J2Z23_004200 [Lederbergia galactosidilyticus]|nr:hypothetical protein [Lederbergia galactosidilytica]